MRTRVFKQIRISQFSREIPDVAGSHGLLQDLETPVHTPQSACEIVIQFLRLAQQEVRPAGSGIRFAELLFALRHGCRVRGDAFMSLSHRNREPPTRGIDIR